MSVATVHSELRVRGNGIFDLLEGEYVIVSLLPGTPVSLPSTGALRVLIADPQEITLILEAQTWQGIAHHHPEAKANRNYRAIRLSQDFPLETVGVMAKLTSALAQAGVSIMAYSTFKTDVVLVREWELSKALGALWDLRF
ncbi:MAG: ACT domain-containing protein [Deinococcales bacterium]